MDPTTIIATIAAVIKEAVDLGPTIIKDVEAAAPFAQALFNNLFKGQTISQDDLTALESSVDALVSQIEEPLPADDGTTTT